MNEELKKIVEEALRPLKNDLAQIKDELVALSALIPKPQELPAPVKEAQQILKAIPQETLAALKIVHVQFDGSQCWMSLTRQDGTSISVKKQEYDFRLRVRDQSGVLLKEIIASPNGLVGGLKSLA